MTKKRMMKKAVKKAKRAVAAPLSTPGSAIDALHRLRVKRKLIEATAEALKGEEKQIEDAIFAKFKNADLEGARGKLAQATISRSDVPSVDDWEKFNAYVLETKSLDLLQRRVVVEAWRERLAAGQVVPGVTTYTKVKLHLTAVKQ